MRRRPPPPGLAAATAAAFLLLALAGAGGGAVDFDDRRPRRSLPETEEGKVGAEGGDSWPDGRVKNFDGGSRDRPDGWGGRGPDGDDYRDATMGEVGIEPVELEDADIDQILASLEANELIRRSGGSVPPLEDQIESYLEDKYRRRLEERLELEAFNEGLDGELEEVERLADEWGLVGIGGGYAR